MMARLHSSPARPGRQQRTQVSGRRAGTQRDDTPKAQYSFAEDATPLWAPDQVLGVDCGGVKGSAPFMALAIAATLAAGIPPAVADEPSIEITADIPNLHEEATSAGIDHVYGGPWEYFVGGGVAAFDCNADGRPDLFFAGGKNPATLYENRSPTGGALRFERKAIGIDDTDLRSVTGAWPVDIDGDGRLDLALSRVGRNLLLKGGPDCSFALANRAWDFAGGRAWTTGFAATWEDGADYPTLAFGNYVDRSAPGSPWGTCHENDLYRPVDGNLSYGDRTPLSPGFCSLSLMFTDWSNRGAPALRITNDRHYYRGGQEQLWRLEPGRPPRLYSASDGWRPLKIWGMGIATGDVDGDNYPEYALTSMGDTRIQSLDPDADEGRPTYTDIALEVGATAHRPYTGDEIRPSTGWHAEFDDVNNDGLTDLFIAKGNVEAMPDFAEFDPDNLLIGGWDGRFREAGDKAGIALDRKGRGAVLADLNLDGMLDLVVVNREAPVSVFRNPGVGTADEPRPMGNFLALKLSQPGGNGFAVGSRVTVKIGTRVLTRDITVGGGHASGELGWLHFGLGTSERAEVRVRWPDGEWSHAYRVFANQFAVIERGEPAAAYWYPADEPDRAAQRNTAADQ